MRDDKTSTKIGLVLSWIIAAILVLLPFHAFLTVWLSSLVGHYTLLRLWKEFLLIFVLAGTIYLLAANASLRRQFFKSWQVRAIAIYAGLLLILGAIVFGRHEVTAKALAYGELVDLRFLAFFLMVAVVAACSPVLIRKWRAVALVPAALVIVFGLLQYWLLPYDFLKHFGYGSATIAPYETINNNIQHLRIESTLRGANPLGAYLVLIFSAVMSAWSSFKNKRWLQYLLITGAFLALIFSYSRSAWIGALASFSVVLWLALKMLRLQRWALVIAGMLIIAGGAAGLTLRHNTTFENAFLHTDTRSNSSTSSNRDHVIAFKNGLRDIGRQPLGQGTGTAGPASVYNNHSTRISENYFLQIGQEAGVLGMVLFITINLMVGRLLWLRRSDPLALALFASLVGLSLVNMLSHAWTDDTLAYIWWGLAGIALSPAILKANKHKRINEKAQQKPT